MSRIASSTLNMWSWLCAAAFFISLVILHGLSARRNVPRRYALVSEKQQAETAAVADIISRLGIAPRNTSQLLENFDPNQPPKKVGAVK